MAGGGGDGDGRGGEGVYVVGVVGGGVGGGVAASASAVSAGWRRGASARGRIPAAGEGPPCRGDPTRGIEPRTPAAGCCRGGPPSGEKRAAPCQAAPHHGQPGQATAERAAQRRWPNGGVRPKAHTFDSRVMALKLPTSGTAPTLVPPPSLPPPPSSSSRTIRAHPIAAWSGSRLDGLLRARTRRLSMAFCSAVRISSSAGHLYSRPAAVWPQSGVNARPGGMRRRRANEWVAQSCLRTYIRTRNGFT